MDRFTARSAPTLDGASPYRHACMALTTAVLVVACASDGFGPDGVGATSGALGELPIDAFKSRVVATEGHPGWTSGLGSVSDDGAAIFNIPLRVPAGRNGIEPTLSLTYHSRSGDGLVGNGWSLAGLSMITRCARNLLLDGETNDVQFTEDDAFCLDGDRLIEAPPGGFWGGGQYRRWRNGFERISLEGGAPGEHGTVFRVETPDGGWHDLDVRRNA